VFDIPNCVPVIPQRKTFLRNLPQKGESHYVVYALEGKPVGGGIYPDHQLLETILLLFTSLHSFITPLLPLRLDMTQYELVKALVEALPLVPVYIITFM